MTLNEESLSLASGVGLSVTGSAALTGSAFFSLSIQTGRQGYWAKPWSTSTAALGSFGSIGTQGSYRTSLAWNYGRDHGRSPSTYSTLGITRWNDGHTYPQAGAVEIGHTGLLCA